MRLKDDQDGAEPATNSVAAGNLLRLAALLDKPALRTTAEKIFGLFHERLTKIPLAMPEMARALMAHSTDPPNVIVTAKDPKNLGRRALEMVRLVQTSKAQAAATLVLADGDVDSILYRNMGVLKDISADEEGVAYVCKNFACSAPIRTLEELEKALEG